MSKVYIVFARYMTETESHEPWVIGVYTTVEAAEARVLDQRKHFNDIWIFEAVPDEDLFGF